ncbi:hypothetical protein Syun_013907 [Stephania yunnanensis]|uniref:Uncharacterized protein n=1 Tax=Stephania yunnanensis TaxID=152371 RepID=A0AAP0JIH2_9MAGN
MFFFDNFISTIAYAALLVSNCALNMACEILQLELGNMNLRLFGSPKVLWTSAGA